MTTFLVACDQQIDIGRRVVTFLEEGAPNFYAEQELTGRSFFSKRAGVGDGPLDQLAKKVTQFCIHHDATWNSIGCYQVLKSRGFSTHLMIESNGLIYQPLDLREAAWHAGEINNISIGIDMNCMANAEILVESEEGRRYAASRGGMYTGVINGARVTSTGYTDAQYDSLVAIIKGLSKSLTNIRLFPPLDTAGEIIKRKIVNYGSFSGFLGHLHVSAKKWDPGPGFDWRRVMIGLHGERNVFPVELPGVKPLAKIYSTSEVAQVAEAYYLNNELGTNGFYPVSLTQSWHSGVHMNVSRSQPVRSVGKGTIVAVRNAPNVELGSPSFVLIKHKVRSVVMREQVGPDRKIIEVKIPVDREWFSLYMHLQYVGETTPLDKRPAWYQELGAREVGKGGFREETFLEQSGTRRPTVGQNFRDLRAGRVVLMNRPVQSGELIGTVGVFGNTADSQRDMIHFEAFSSEGDPLFEPTQFPTTWRAIEADEGDDSLAEIDEVWRPIFEVANFIRSNVAKLNPDQRILKPSEILTFYQGDSKEKLIFRGYVTQHISEWSDQMDWRKTAPISVGWQWETQRAYDQFIERWAPFMWLNAEVARHAGIDPSHLVWTYNPITLISWFHVNYGRQLSPDDFQEGFSNSALIDQRKRETALSKKDSFKGGWHGDGEQDQIITDDQFEILEVNDAPWKEEEQGEWPM